MFIGTPRLLGLVLLASSPLGFCSPLGADTGIDRADGREIVRPDTPTYRFTARIDRNGGVLPFEVGKTIRGSFTYDLAAGGQSRGNATARSYTSPRNAFSFQLGKLRFSGAGHVSVAVASYDGGERVSITAHDLVLPAGWEMDHKAKSQSYALVLRNAPPKGAFQDLRIPTRLRLSDFTGARDFRLVFCHGILVPGSPVAQRAIVSATVQTLEEVGR